jgi:hypothetical protein
MLGFHPTNSLVLMCLSGGRRRVGPVARVDLPAGHDRPLAQHLTLHALRHADEVVVICYQTSRRRPPLLDDLLRELARAGVDVMDAMVVRDGTARHALTAEIERSHPGFPVPQSDDPQVRHLTAAGALAGRSVLADREQLRKSIAGPTGERLRAAEWHINEAASGRLPSDDPPQDNARTQSGATSHPGFQRFQALEALVEQAFAQIRRCGQVEVEQATAIGVLVSDVPLRDWVLARAVAEMKEPWLPTLISCATWLPDALAAPLCSVLAATAYRHGDGALAQLAVDRCLISEPRHQLAHLMLAVMSTGMRPEELERIATDGSYDDCEPNDWPDGSDDEDEFFGWPDAEL